MTSSPSDPYAMNPASEMTGGEVLNTLVNPNTGYLFGVIKLPPAMREVWKFVAPSLESEIGKIGEQRVASWVAQAAKHVKQIPNPEKVGHIAGRVFNYGLPFAGAVGDVARTLKGDRENKRQVMAALAPLLAANKEQDGKGVMGSVAGMFRSGAEGNEVIAHAMRLVRENTKQELTDHAMSAFPIAVQTYRTKNYGDYEQARKEGNQQEVQRLEALDGNLQKWVIPLASGLTVAGRQSMHNKHRGEDISGKLAKSSFGAILELQEYIRAEGLDDPKSRSGNYHQANVAQLVEQAFQRAQKEQGRKQIPPRRLREVSQLIAEELINGEMHALSLVNIVGKKELLNQRGDALVNDEKVAAALQKEKSRFSKSSTVDVAAFMDEVDYTLGDVKRHIESDKKDERAIAVLLHPDAVLAQAGMKHEAIAEARQHLAGELTRGVIAAVVEDAAQRNDDQALAEMGFDKQSIHFIRRFEGDPARLAYALEDPQQKEQALAVARMAIMQENEANTPQKWTELVRQGREVAAELRGEEDARAPRHAPRRRSESMQGERDDTRHRGRHGTAYSPDEDYSRGR